MKKLFPGLLVFLLAFAGTVNTPTPDPITVEGILVDTKCYGMMPEMNKGNTHQVPKMDHGKAVMKDGKPVLMEIPACATACAKMGIPAGIVDAEGKTYIIVASAMALADHMAKEARVTGELAYAGGIIATKVEVKEDGEWIDVTPGAMM